MSRGTIFNIQRFCVHDGPGIRTTVFFKGCPLRCAWCHNPESQRGSREILFDASKCVLCGACATVCPEHLHAFSESSGHTFDRDGCVRCGACASVCYAGALESCGREADVDEIIAEVLRDEPFYRTGGGGMTLSGGEPMAQPAFALELSRAACEKGLSVCVETCGQCDRDALEAMIPYVSLFLYDFKIAPGEEHRRYTGTDGSRIRQNLEALDRAGAGLWLRCPIIPDVNLSQAHFDAIAELTARCRGIQRVDLEPYHPLGLDKLRKLGREAHYTNADFLDRGAVEPLAQALAKRVDVPVTLGGELIDP